jgi:ABC-2 type transport system ATP-binding protein
MSQPIVEVSHVSRQFGATRALDAVSLETPRACVHGLVGVNGAGKTTLIKHILGLLKAKTGTVRIFGLDPVRHPVEVLQRIGYLSEERDLPEWMRISELMWYTQAYHPNWDMDYADELLKTFGLDPSKKIKDLSRGMRAQVGLIASVAHRPDLLLLDEPSSGLDAVVRRDILNAIVRTVADDERTVLFSSHLLDEVEQLSDYVTMIQEGRVVLQGTLDEIKEQHHLLNIRLAAPSASPPVLEGTLSLEGEGRTWTAICANGLDRVREGVSKIGGEIVELRNASLQEIFIARVGRKYLPVQEG